MKTPLPFRFRIVPQWSVALVASFMAAVALCAEPSAPAASLEASFENPPAAAKPSIWWFWGESVTTDEGITKDLEALKRAGFGGVVIYEQLFTDRPGALKSLSPEWLARFRFAAAECARLGMTLEVNASNGFVAGGPWITPELAMQRLVASETVVTGGETVRISLPKPPSRPDFYRDVAVLAYPTPSGGGAEALPEPVLTSDPPDVDLKAMFRKDGRSKAVIPVREDGKPIIVRMDFGKPQTACSLSYSSRSKLKGLIIATQVPTSWADDAYGQAMRFIPPLGRLEASEDGKIWREICEIPAFGSQIDGWTQRTASFAATTARYFRLHLNVKDEELAIGSVELRSEARIDQWEIKSGNVTDFSDPDRTPDYAGREVIDPETVLDLSRNLDPQGNLSWDAPKGSWTILRLGHTPTGARTKHGRPEGMGLECDKLSAKATKTQFDYYVSTLLRETSKVTGAKISGINIDSNEHGSQNWTSDFEAQFKKRRGYAPRKFLPAMMGRVVASREVSDKFLFDVRRTIADLMSDEYFGTFQKLCHAEGMTSMAQAPGIATCLPSDNIQAKSRADIPMGEFWMSQRDGTIDCKEAASAAHVYGLPLAAAEAFTGSRPDVHPAVMKPFADAALALGINRFVVLAYVHQPFDNRWPGITQDRFFLPYQRHNPWWDDGLGFWNSISRSSHLMRQGHAVADLLYHLGNDAPLKIATWRMRPAPPAGYDYDVCGDEALIQRADVKDGRIVLPDGMSYRMLVLAGGERMTLSAAEKLRKLVRAGAAVLGPVKPAGSPSLTDGLQGDATVREIADELWGTGPITGKGRRDTGKGRVLWGMSPAEALKEINTPRDFAILPESEAADLIYAHRRTADEDIYFVANRRAEARKFTAVFRVTGRSPERWDSETGIISSISGWQETDGRTEVPLAMEAQASTFIVFRRKAGTYVKPASQLNADLPVFQTLSGPWKLVFQPGRGAPESIQLPQLMPWNEHPEPGIRYFSGSATYRTQFDVQRPANAERVMLDLGKVAVLAAVKLNGRDFGVVWKEPYAFDVTEALHPGRNDLEIRVVNTWVNRQIGDASLPEGQRITSATWSPFKPTDPLSSSGLLGPVVLRSAKIP